MGRAQARPTASVFGGLRGTALDDDNTVVYNISILTPLDGGCVVWFWDPNESNFVLGITIGLVMAVIWHVVVRG